MRHSFYRPLVGIDLGQLYSSSSDDFVCHYKPSQMRFVLIIFTLFYAVCTPEIKSSLDLNDAKMDIGAVAL